MNRETADCLALLRSAAEPLTAITIATRLHWQGSRESLRRKVRGVIATLRESGHRIVATLESGYWLTDDDATWREYQDNQMISAKKLIGEVSRRQKEIAANNGQGMLFGPAPAGTMIGH